MGSTDQLLKLEPAQETLDEGSSTIFHANHEAFKIVCEKRLVLLLQSEQLAP